jgi:hypothetical protein
MSTWLISTELGTLREMTAPYLLSSFELGSCGEVTVREA